MSKALINSPYELPLAAKGKVLAGVDEAGRGPLAGPVTAACAVLPEGYLNPLINDSKKLSEKKREFLFDEIKDVSLAFSVVSVGPRRIEKLNILAASLEAMKLSCLRVQEQLQGQEVFFLIDGNQKMPGSFMQEAVVKGDSRVLHIAAASILAKVTRDRLMKKLDDYYPGYGLAGHKGYPTKSHKEAVVRLGPALIHRKSFSGVKEVLSNFS